MYEERFQHVMQQMQELALDQLLLSDPDSIYYLTGYYNEPMERLMALYLDRSGRKMFFLNRLFPVPEAPIDQVWFTDADDAVQEIANRVNAEGNLGVDKDWPARYLLPLQEKCPHLKTLVGSAAVDDVRAQKDQREIELMREASRINDLVMERTAAYIREDMTELEIANYMEEQYQLEGCEGPSFELIVSFGANASDPHHRPDTTSRLQEGDCILLDIGCRKDGYCSDMTRTYFWKKVSPKHRAIHDRVREANEKAEAQIRPGVPFSGLDAAAREWISEGGYGSYFTHRLGHFIGQRCHEKGDVSRGNSQLTAVGNIFSIEPGIYLPGEMGVRIEDLCLVTEDGVEILNKVDKRLRILGLD